MFAINKTLIKIGIVLSLLTALFFFLKQFTVIRTKVVYNYENGRKKDSISVATLTKELSVKDSLYFGSQDMIGIKDNQIRDLQTQNKNLNDETKRLRLNESSCCSEVQHLESSGMIKHDSIFLSFEKKFLKKGEWIVIQRPKKINYY